MTKLDHCQYNYFSIIPLNDDEVFPIYDEVSLLLFIQSTVVDYYNGDDLLHTHVFEIKPCFG
jgi:hypothetical protein